MNPQCKVVHSGDIHLEEDRYFEDTAQCLEWLVEDGSGAGADLFVINGDLTTYKATIKERNLWIDMLIRMAEHAPVILVAGNHGCELDRDLYVYSRSRSKNIIHLFEEPGLIEVGAMGIAVFPYPRKADFLSGSQEETLSNTFIQQLDEFNRWFHEHRDRFRLFFGHFGVTGARVSGGQPLVGRCAEYPLEPLRGVQAQYVGLSHIHLRQQLTPRVWYAGSLSRCDYSEVEEKGYNLVTLKTPQITEDGSDVEVEFRRSPTRALTELQVRYEDGEFHLPTGFDRASLKDSRVKVIVTVAQHTVQSLSRDEQNRLRDMLFDAKPAELKMKIEHEPEAAQAEPGVSSARSAAEKLRAYWEIRKAPPAEQQLRLLAKLGDIEAMLAKERPGL
jgi:DNA repair exonuclease SbcCD nuclease subunit